MLVRKSQARSELTRETSIRDFTIATGGGDEQKWQKTAGAKQLREDLMTHELDVLLCERLKQVLEIKDGTARREFSNLFTPGN